MKRRSVAWIGGAVIVAVGAIAWFRLHAGQNTVKAQYRVAAVQKTDIRKTVSASGTLQPWTTVDVKSKAGGRIDLLAVDVGDRVKNGQIIAKIDPTDSLLTYNQARADTESAVAKQQQAGQTYTLQTAQTRTSIEQAYANLLAAKANLGQVQARLQSANTESGAQPALTDAAINQARATYDAAVQARNKLTATQAQDRASAQSAYDQAVANDASAQANLQRQRQLLQKGFVAQSAVETAQASAGVTKATVSGAKAKLDTLANQQQAERQSAEATVTQALAALKTAQVQSIVIESKRNSAAEERAAVAQAAAQVSQTQAAYDEAVAGQQNNGIKSLDITSAKASTERARATLTNAKTTLDQTTVRAPSEGVVLLKYVEQGTIITSGLSLSSSGTSIVQLGDVTRMYVDVAVDETDIASIKPKQSVDVTFDAFPGRTFKGKVAKINPAAVVESNVTTIHVRVEVDNTSQGFSELKPTMNATCEFIIGEADNVLAVTSDAVHTEGDSSYVEVVDSSQPAPKSTSADVVVDVKSHKQTVTVGLTGTDTTEIKTGLSEGDTVVVGSVASSDAADSSSNAAFGGMPRMRSSSKSGSSAGGPPPR